MKRTITTIALFAALAISTGVASAQIAAYRQGNGASVEGYSLPRTVITATIVQEREVVLRGPYARYASQYLGIVGAAMSDKESYKIVGASLSYFDEPDPNQVFVFDEKSPSPAKIFTWLSPQNPFAPIAADMDYKGGQTGNSMPFTDLGISPIYGQTVQNNAVAEGGPEAFPALTYGKTEAVEKSPEQMAADAAAAIFKLRKRRFELVTGEQGENVFGAGLEAALREIDKIEAEYLALFIGKRFSQRTVKIVSVLPEAGKNRITMCRFSDSKGVVPDSDVSGRPITAELTPEKSGAQSAAAAMASRKGAGRSVVYRVPQVENVRLVDGTEILSEARIPVYQLGVSVDAPIVFGI